MLYIYRREEAVYIETKTPAKRSSMTMEFLRESKELEEDCKGELQAMTMTLNLG